MPVKVEKDNWVSVFRDQIKDSIAESDQWFITNCRGKMRLQVKEDGKVATRILPFEWNKKTLRKHFKELGRFIKTIHHLKERKHLQKLVKLLQLLVLLKKSHGLN